MIFSLFDYNWPLWPYFPSLHLPFWCSQVANIHFSPIFRNSSSSGVNLILRPKQADFHFSAEGWRTFYSYKMSVFRCCSSRRYICHFGVSGIPYHWPGSSNFPQKLGLGCSHPTRTAQIVDFGFYPWPRQFSTSRSA